MDSKQLITRLNNVIDLLEEAVDDLMFIQTRFPAQGLAEATTTVVDGIDQVRLQVSELTE